MSDCFKPAIGVCIVKTGEARVGYVFGNLLKSRSY